MKITGTVVIVATQTRGFVCVGASSGPLIPEKILYLLLIFQPPHPGSPYFHTAHMSTPVCASLAMKDLHPQLFYPVLREQDKTGEQREERKHTTTLSAYLSLLAPPSGISAGSVRQSRPINKQHI